MKTSNADPRTLLDAAGLSRDGRHAGPNADQYVLADLSRSLRVRTTSLSVADASRVTADLRAHLLLVADGGAADSARRTAVASRLVAGEASRQVLENVSFRNGGVPAEELRDELRELVAGCASALATAGDRDPALGRCAPSLTLGFLRGDELHLAHAGGTRAYLLRDSRLERLTADDARRPPTARRALAQPQVTSHDVGDADAVLLCTEGLTRHVPEERILRILSTARGAEQACHLLLQAAEGAGVVDDVTVVVGSLRAPAAVPALEPPVPRRAAERARARRPKLVAHHLTHVPLVCGRPAARSLPC